MSHYEAGPLAAYNSLQDPHLQSYHANTQIRKHLIKSGLVSKHGDIISENRYRLQIAKKEHRKNVKDMLATAIVHKALDMERMRQYEIRKRLDELYKIDVVQRVKAERTKKSDQELIAVLSPRSSSATQKKKSRRKARKQLQHETLASATKLPSIHPDEKSARVKSYIESTSSGAGESSQQSFQPRPPKSRSKKSKGTRLMRSEPPIAHKIQLQSMAEVTMKFLGSPLNLASDMFPMNRLHEVTILQQHSGGSTLCVFREMLPPNTVFTFISRRHRGSPFGLTMNIGNICNARLSTCCEYKHKCGYKVGGKHSQFALISVHGAAPCYRCQIRLNLLEPNKSKTEEQHSDESDAESAVRSYDVIVSRNAQYPPSPEPSVKEKEPARPTSAAAATQTTDNEEVDEEKKTQSADATDEFHLPDKDKYSSGSEDDSDEDLSDDDFDEEALTRTEEDNGSGSESDSESEEDDIDEQEQLSVNESQTETENSEAKVGSDEEEGIDSDKQSHSSSASSSDSELEELKDDGEDAGTDHLAVDAVDARPSSVMISEAVIATTDNISSEDEEDKDADAKVDSDDQKYDEEFEKKSSGSSSSSSDSESEKEEDKDDIGKEDDQEEKDDAEKIDQKVDEVDEEVDSPEESKETPEITAEGGAMPESSEIEEMASTEKTMEDTEATIDDAPAKLDRPSSAVIIRERPSSGILSSRPSSSRPNSSGSKKNVTFNQDIQVETYEKVDVPTITTVSTDEYSEDDAAVADLPEDSDNDLAGDDFAGERIVVLQDLADTTDEETSNRSGEEQTTDEEKDITNKATSENTDILKEEKAEVSKDTSPEESTLESEEEIDKKESEQEESERNEPEVDVNDSKDKALEVKSDDKNEDKDASETEKKQGIFEYGQLHYSDSLELIKPKDEISEDVETGQEDAMPLSEDVKEEANATKEVEEEEKEIVVVPLGSSTEDTEVIADEVKENNLDEVTETSEEPATGDPAFKEPVSKESEDLPPVESASKESVPVKSNESTSEESTNDESSSNESASEESTSNDSASEESSPELEKDKVEEMKETYEVTTAPENTIIAAQSNIEDEKEKEASALSESILSDALAIVVERCNSQDVQADIDADAVTDVSTVQENKEESSQEAEEQEVVTSGDEPVTSDSEAEAATFDHGHEFKPTPDEYEMTREKSNENLRSLIKSVKEVELNSLELDDNQTRELAEFLYAEADEIESLSLRNTTLSGVSREIFEKMEGLSKLKMLNLNMCNLKFNEMRYLYDVISSDECGIQTLLLHGNPLGDAGIETLTDGLMKNGSITSLNIGGCSISDEGIVKIAEWVSQSKTLTDLTLSENISIGKQGWQALAMALEQNQTLETLAVDFCELKDEGCLMLSAGIAKSSLKSLDIEGNQITDQGGKYLLEAIKACVSLRDVTLTPQNQFSEEMEDRLKDTLKEK